MTPANPPTASLPELALSHRLKHWIMHPIFPLVCIIPITQAIRDQYPISHYPMYSQPTSSALLFVYVAGADGKALPITTHTSVTPSQVGKKYGRHKLDLIKKEEKRSGKGLDEEDVEASAQIKADAGRQTLTFLRDLSLKRKPALQLKSAISLVEVTLGFGDAEFTEAQHVIAELPAMP